jgi:hypothetical protein
MYLNEDARARVADQVSDALTDILIDHFSSPAQIDKIISSVGVSIEQAAQILEVPYATVQSWSSRDILKTQRAPGKDPRILLGDLVAFAKNTFQQPPSVVPSYMKKCNCKCEMCSKCMGC